MCSQCLCQALSLSPVLVGAQIPKHWSLELSEAAEAAHSGGPGWQRLGCWQHTDTGPGVSLGWREGPSLTQWSPSHCYDGTWDSKAWIESLTDGSLYLFNIYQGKAGKILNSNCWFVNCYLFHCPWFSHFSDLMAPSQNPDNNQRTSSMWLQRKRDHYSLFC